jgi:hypothetical protein
MPVELTAAQRQLLRTLPERIPLARIDRLWIFAPHLGRARETGLFVASLLPTDDARPGQRVLLSLSYAAQSRNGQLQVEQTATEEGRTTPERIERVITGVLARAADFPGEPLLETIAGCGERWAALLARLAPGA